jgi:hypothetical protein
MTSGTVKDAILPAVQRLAYYTGRATSGLRMTPGLLVCGAQRCGTTSMYQALRQHPAVLRPVTRKGVHYYDVDYARGPGWYRAHFPLELTARRRQHRLGTRVMTFESSPYYLFHPLAAQRIATDLPGVKILILVRDPVERAYSAYTHEFARGFETESFERALELEDSRLADEEERLIADPAAHSHAHQHQAYVRRGFYIDQIVRMIDAVGSDHVHVIDAEDFFAEPEKAWAAVTDFLGLPEVHGLEFKQHNARARSAMPESVRRSLEERFEDSDERLASWWGRTPSWRR